MLLRIAQLIVYAFLFGGAAMFIGDLTGPDVGLPGAAQLARYGLPISILGLVAWHFHCKNPQCQPPDKTV